MKYNKSEIMKRAWEIRRKTGCNMSDALKKAWARAKRRAERAAEEARIAEEEARAAQERENRINANPVCSKLIAAGGRLWENYGKCRVYLNYNAIAAICGLDELEYNRVDGEKISNTTRRQYVEAMQGDIYYDVVENTWNWNHSYRYTDNIIDRLCAACK